MKFLLLVVLCALCELPPAKGATPVAPADGTATKYALGDALPGVKFDQPVAIVSAPGDAKRMFIVEKTGRVQAVSGLETPNPAKQLFLDVTSPRDGKLDFTGECGLLGLAFPPDHAKSGRCFVYYSLQIGGKLHERLSRFNASATDSNRMDAGSEQPLFTQVDESTNHNGGDLHFGPDGYLYVSVGDGGVADDKLNNARFINKGFTAAILRIDVDKKPGALEPNPHPGIARDASGAAFYAVPPDNPFIGATSHQGQSIDPKTVRTETWATGLRNPWRFSFDPANGRLFTGDVGQNLYEEIDLIVKGGDYGWSYREAMHPFDKRPGKDEPAGFKPIDPIFEYPRTVGVSVTGGVVYRGEGFADLNGAYLFADFGTGAIMALRENGNTWAAETIARDAGIAGIGIDPRDGSVLFANLTQGKIRKLQQR